MPTDAPGGTGDDTVGLGVAEVEGRGESEKKLEEVRSAMATTLNQDVPYAQREREFRDYLLNHPENTEAILNLMLDLEYHYLSDLWVIIFNFMKERVVELNQLTAQKFLSNKAAAWVTISTLVDGPLRQHEALVIDRYSRSDLQNLAYNADRFSPEGQEKIKTILLENVNGEGPRLLLEYLEKFQVVDLDLLKKTLDQQGYEGWKAMIKYSEKLHLSQDDLLRLMKLLAPSSYYMGSVVLENISKIDRMDDDLAYLIFLYFNKMSERVWPFFRDHANIFPEELEDRTAEQILTESDFGDFLPYINRFSPTYRNTVEYHGIEDRFWKIREKTGGRFYLKDSEKIPPDNPNRKRFYGLRNSQDSITIVRLDNGNHRIIFSSDSKDQQVFEGPLLQALNDLENYFESLHVIQNQT